MEGDVAHLHTRPGTQESLCQLICPRVLGGQAEEVVAFRLLILLGLFQHLAHHPVEDVVRSHDGYLAQRRGNRLQADCVRELFGLVSDTLIAYARNADHIGREAQERELAVIVADGATREGDIDADVRHRLRRLGIYDDSAHRVKPFLRPKKG